MEIEQIKLPEEEIEHIDFEEEDCEESCEPEGLDLDVPYTPLVQKSGIIQHEHRNVDDRPDSISIGTDGKGGTIKVYFNADDSERETEDRIVRAFAARKKMQDEYALQQNEGNPKSLADEVEKLKKKVAEFGQPI